MLDFSCLFHLINPKVFCLHVIKSMPGPAVIWTLNLLFFFIYIFWLFPDVSFSVAEGQISVLIKKELFSVLKVFSQQTSYETNQLKFQQAACLEGL